MILAPAGEDVDANAPGSRSRAAEKRRRELEERRRLVDAKRRKVKDERDKEATTSVLNSDARPSSNLNAGQIPVERRAEGKDADPFSAAEAQTQRPKERRHGTKVGNAVKHRLG